jgi:hypothetical protein
MATCAFFLFSNRTKPFPLDPNAPLLNQPPHPEPRPVPYKQEVEQQTLPSDPIS